MLKAATSSKIDLNLKIFQKIYFNLYKSRYIYLYDYRINLRFRYGRKGIFVICILLMSLSGAAQVASPEYVTFVVLIFINALGTAGVYPLAFIIGKNHSLTVPLWKLLRN